MDKRSLERVRGGGGGEEKNKKPSKRVSEFSALIASRVFLIIVTRINACDFLGEPGGDGLLIDANRVIDAVAPVERVATKRVDQFCDLHISRVVKRGATRDSTRRINWSELFGVSA